MNAPQTTVMICSFLVSSCVVQTTPVKGDKGEPGAPGADGKDATLPADLDARLKAFENSSYCPRLVDKAGHPRSYVPDLTVPGVVRCAFGDDEMIKVGGFWIDRYEATLVPESFYSEPTMGSSGVGACAGEATPYASQADVDDYPAEFPDNGHWTTPVYACSVAGHPPSRMMTWFQAQQACALVGKRLCRNDEWQTAAAGTIDPGESVGTGGACVTKAPALRATGDGVACRSSYGAEDMIGNLWEWTAEWHAAPGTDQLTPAPVEAWDVAHGNDTMWNISGTARDTQVGGWGHRLPAVALRGGDRVEGAGSGAFAMNIELAPSEFGTTIGVRCCAGQ